jgi:hypothetical protein
MLLCNGGAFHAISRPQGAVAPAEVQKKIKINCITKMLSPSGPYLNCWLFKMVSHSLLLESWKFEWKNTVISNGTIFFFFFNWYSKQIKSPLLGLLVGCYRVRNIVENEKPSQYITNRVKAFTCGARLQVQGKWKRECRVVQVPMCHGKNEKVLEIYSTEMRMKRCK